jgi:hypothetical protein
MLQADSFHNPRTPSTINQSPFTRLGRHSRSLTTKNTSIRQLSLGGFHQRDKGSKGGSDVQAQQSIEQRDSYKAFLRRQSILRRLDSKQSDHSADIFKAIAQPSYDLQIRTGWPESLSQLNDSKAKLRDCTPEMRRLETELVHMHAFTARHGGRMKTLAAMRLADVAEINTELCLGLLLHKGLSA